MSKAERDRAYYARNREAIRAKAAAYRAANRELIRARDIAADHVDPRRDRRPTQPCVEPFEESVVETGAHGEIDDACRRDSTHRGHVAQIHGQGPGAERLGGHPRALEMDVLDHRVDGDDLRDGHRRDHRAVVPDSENRPAALRQLRAQPRDQLEFLQGFGRRSRQWATTIEVATIVRAGLPRLVRRPLTIRNGSSLQG